MEPPPAPPAPSLEEPWGKLDGGSRRLGQRNLTTCQTHSNCQSHEYCMDCNKCAEFHESLPVSDRSRWTCAPCTEGAKFCESGRYCSVANDAVDGSCPVFEGCSAHSDCPGDEYCYSCQECGYYISNYTAIYGHPPIWQCQPCPTSKGGFCSMNSWCGYRRDAIDRTCPPPTGCSSHSECGATQYCEGCEKCEEFKNSLPVESRARWSCNPCPTVGGGICEGLQYCQHANDGIDGTCPLPTGCNSHLQCNPDEYCMSCQNCTKYHDSLPESEKLMWTCDPCPTELQGTCELRQFCSKAQDPFGGGECPEYHGCAQHTDCPFGDFCMSHQKCELELGDGKCGDEGLRGGTCIPQDYCTPGRSVDGLCRGEAPCNTHADCNTADTLATHYCTPYDECMEIAPERCGQKVGGKDGVCLLLEHCVRGLHAPVDGRCPASVTSRGETRVGAIAIAEATKLEDTIQFAIHHQAMNVWPSQFNGRTADMVLAQLHDYGPLRTSRLDDVEYVGLSYARNGLLEEDRLVQLSCPSVEIAIPRIGSHFYEARVHSTEFEMSQSHAECSCVVGETRGRCPRAVSYSVPVDGNEADKRCGSITLPTGAGIYTFAESSKVAGLDACQGAVQVETNFFMKLKWPSSVVTSFKYYRLDNYIEEHFDCSTPAKCHGVTLTLDGHSLLCELAVGATGSCQQLPVAFEVEAYAVEVILSAPINADTVFRGNRFCGWCSDILTRLYPVLFLDGLGYPVANNLSLYSYTETLSGIEGRVIDSSIVAGVGAPEKGCPRVEDEDTRGASLLWLRENSKVLPEGHVKGLWCVVQSGGCTLSTKYKLCVLGGAAGVLIMDPPSTAPDEDKVARIYLDAGETPADMKPVVYAKYTDKLWKSLTRKDTTDFSGIWHKWADGETKIVQSGSSVAITNPVATWSPATGTVSGNKLTISGPAEIAGLTATLKYDNDGMKLMFSDGHVMKREEAEISAGPDIGRRPRLGYGVTTLGGIMSYDVPGDKWAKHTGVVGAVQWVEHSDVRKVLFVCTAEYKIVVMDTSDPSTPQSLRILNSIDSALACRRAPLFRDYHVVDLKRGSKFFTVLVDMGDGNTLEFYDTTDIKNWKLVSKVEADWEHDSEGLGQVVPSVDNSKLIVTWHCSTIYCRDAISRGTEPGQRVYVLDLVPLDQGLKPLVAGIISMPMSRGSIVRDVACTDQNICLASLSWDGVVAFDLADGPNRFRVIAEHSASFRGPEVPEAAAWIRMTSGAQKVYASATGTNTFYVEQWSLNMTCLIEGKSLASCLRYDTMWSVGVHYVRPIVTDSQPMRPESGTIYIKGASFDHLLHLLPKATPEHMAEVAAVALQDALHVGSDRVHVYAVSPMTNAQDGAMIKFKILPSVSGATPERLMRDLMVQIKTPGSAWRTGPMRQFAPAASLVWDGHDEKADGSTVSDDDDAVAATSRVVEEEEDLRNGRFMRGFMGLLIVALLLAVGCACCALLYAMRQRAAARKAQRQQPPPVEMQPPYSPQGGGFDGGAAGADGLVIGRPAGGGQPAPAAAGPGGAAYVVGMPLQGTGAGGAVASGAPLSETDKGKMAAEASPRQAEAPGLPSNAALDASATEPESPTAAPTSVLATAPTSAVSAAGELSPAERAMAEAVAATTGMTVAGTEDGDHRLQRL